MPPPRLPRGARLHDTRRRTGPVQPASRKPDGASGHHAGRSARSATARPARPDLFGVADPPAHRRDWRRLFQRLARLHLGSLRRAETVQHRLRRLRPAIHIPPQLKREELEQYVRLVEEQMQKATDAAERWRREAPTRRQTRHGTSSRSGEPVLEPCRKGALDCSCINPNECLSCASVPGRTGCQAFRCLRGTRQDGAPKLAIPFQGVRSQP